MCMWAGAGKGCCYAARHVSVGSHVLRSSTGRMPDHHPSLGMTPCRTSLLPHASHTSSHPSSPSSPAGHAESAGGAPAGGPPGLPFLQSVPGGMRASSSGGSPLQSSAALSGGGGGGGAAALGLEAAAGEYRGIMSLCRLLPGGFEAKLAVDAAIAAIAKQVGGAGGWEWSGGQGGCVGGGQGGGCGWRAGSGVWVEGREGVWVGGVPGGGCPGWVGVCCPLCAVNARIVTHARWRARASYLPSDEHTRTYTHTRTHACTGG